MIGGKIIEIVPEDGRVFVNVRDTAYPKDRCGIYVEKNQISERMEIGDSLWWQGAFAMWTPESYQQQSCSHREHITCNGRSGIDYDIKIPRLSYSGVDHPEGRDVLNHSRITEQTHDAN